MTVDLRRIDLRPAESPAPTSTPPIALTIAGSDSGGGAGIAADLRTFAALGVFGTLAITAVTAQDTLKVHDVTAFPPEFLDVQLDAVLGDFEVAAAKTGMLATVSIIDRLVQRASEGRLPPLVVDPVMVSTSGAALVEGDAPSAYRRLLPFARVVTPNLIEAGVLLGRELRDVDDMAAAARELVDLGAELAVVKGGHLSSNEAIDVVATNSETVALVDEMVRTENVHGTGCTLSAAITARLASGDDPLEAVIAAKRYLAAVIRASAHLRLGEGPGPLDHLALLREAVRRS